MAGGASESVPSMSADVIRELGTKYRFVPLKTRTRVLALKVKAEEN